MREVFERLRLRVFERGWLSSNNILFDAHDDAPATLVDSGYAAHAEQTVALVEQALGNQRLGRVINTHLHSDHCGGNAALHARWGCDIVVPHVSFDAVRTWDANHLTFQATDQRCDRFPVHASIAPGDRLCLGGWRWDVHAAPGHDPEAVLLFQPDLGVLISGDALWQARVAIIFPELEGQTGFAPALRTLDLIESLGARVVMPGHGAPFTDVAAALKASRNRLHAFAAEPAKHLQYAGRALLMFHMLECRRSTRVELLKWLDSTPIVRQSDLATGLAVDPSSRIWADELIDRLLRDNVLVANGDEIGLAS